MSAGRYEPPRFEVLKTLAEIASETKRPLRTIQRQLVAVHRADVERGKSGWLFRISGKRWLVNASMLRAVHPEFFSARYFSRDEADVLVEDVAVVKTHTRNLTKALNATRARLREEIDAHVATRDRLAAVIKQNQLAE